MEDACCLFVCLFVCEQVLCVCHHSWIWDHREASKQASDVVCVCVCVAFEQSMVFEAGNKHGVCVCCVVMGDGAWQSKAQCVCSVCVHGKRR